jgi:hypothetical protein
MTQHSRNKPVEGQGNPARGEESQDRKRYEGFEGMNYEQRRQPFDPHKTGNSRGMEDNTAKKSGNER